MMQFFKKRWYLIVIFLIIIGGIFFKINSDKASGKAAKKQSTYVVKRKNLEETLSLSGSINAEEHTILRFQTSGMLTWVGVKEGDYVKKYQGVASLDQKELQKNLTKYLNTYMKSRWDFETTRETEDIKNIGGLSEDARRAALRTLDKAQFDLNNSVIDVELKDIALKFAYLYTPIEGIVTKVESPYAGVNITPVQAEFEIINPKTIYFSATADQSDVVKLRQDAEGDVVLDSYPNSKLKGKVYMISFVPKTGETGTVYSVKIALQEPNDDYRYRYGMTGDASFKIREIKDVLSIPTKFIKAEKNPEGTLDKKYVLKKVNGSQAKAYIQIGEEMDDNTIVTAGLKEGDLIYD